MQEIEETKKDKLEKCKNKCKENCRIFSNDLKPLALLDLINLKIVKYNLRMKYVAISYTWGTEVDNWYLYSYACTHNYSYNKNIKYNKTDNVFHIKFSDFKFLINVLKNKGYKYLWIDILCGKQIDKIVNTTLVSAHNIFKEANEVIIVPWLSPRKDRNKNWEGTEWIRRVWPVQELLANSNISIWLNSEEKIIKLMDCNDYEYEKIEKNYGIIFKDLIKKVSIISIEIDPLKKILCAINILVNSDGPDSKAILGLSGMLGCNNRLPKGWFVWNKTRCWKWLKENIPLENYYLFLICIISLNKKLLNINNNIGF